LAVLAFTFFNYADAGKINDIKRRVRGVFTPKPFSLSPTAAETRNRIFYSPTETVITAGPDNNSLVPDTHVEFTLDGWQIVPFTKTSRFDVWLMGFDGGWKEVSNRVVYDLPPGRKTYTLLARAKNSQNEYDNSAAVRTFATNVSPYFKQLSINNVNYRGDYSKPQNEKIAIYDNLSGQQINISGWKIVTQRFNFSFEIPRAASVLNPRDFSANDPIVLNQGNSLDIYVGKRSPVGVNFEENSCTSFFGSYFEGYDALSGYGSCPSPDSSSYNQFSVDCRSFIRGLSSCRDPQLVYYQFINEPACRDFIIKNFSYQACVELAKDKANFYSGRWKVYLGRNEEILDDLNDTIYLYDGQGLLVDKYSY